MSRLKEQYQNEIIDAMIKKFGYKNIMEVPKLDKVVINMGVGEAKDNAKALDSAVADMEKITGQKAVLTRAKNSVANFKIREGMPIGCKVTLRGEKMYEFADRLINLALPRVRDFRGVNPNAFDGRGNYAHERPATASKPSAEKMQEVKRPATATTSKASEPVKTNVIKERPLSSGASDRKATQSAQPAHRQNVEKVVSQETRQNYTKDRRTKVQQTQSVQKNQQTTEKTRNLVTKKGQKKK